MRPMPFSPDCFLRHAVLAMAVAMGLAFCDPRGTAAGTAIGPESLLAEAIVTFLDTDGRPRATIRAQIADTPSARRTGLMNRTRLDPDAGMLFVYPDAAERVFWMRDTPLPLDILFISDADRVTHIVRGTQPLSDHQYPSLGPAKYVVEVNAGFADAWGIAPGMRIRWNRKP